VFSSSLHFFQAKNCTKEILLKIYLLSSITSAKYVMKQFMSWKKSDIVVTESYNAVEVFRNKILSRISDGFVGGETKALIKDFLANEQGKITKNRKSF
jgi:hypothetical protein